MAKNCAVVIGINEYDEIRASELKFFLIIHLQKCRDVPASKM
jgi:hypothetical protein